MSEQKATEWAPLGWLAPLRDAVSAQSYVFIGTPNVTSIGDVWHARKGTETVKIAPRTCAKRLLHARYKNGAWTTFSKVDLVALVCEAPAKRAPAEVLEFRLIPSAEVVARLEALRIAKAKAGHKLNESYALRLDLKDLEVHGATYAGSGLAQAYQPLEATAIGGLTGDIMTSSATPHSIAAWIERARVDVAGLVGLPIEQVRVRVELGG
jgi:hypothetical protein